ncbi:MAG: TlpA family protein disulfide reductase [Flavobacteriales bacterium]|nr:TlpA family protein disulfide reductase [Flavobacteriales bacterium]
MKKILYIFLAIIIASCSGDSFEQEQETSSVLLVEGSWLLEFQLSENNVVPVNFNLIKIDSSYHVEFSNAAEKILAKDVSVSGNKITIHDPIFKTWFEGKIVNSTTIEGKWFKDGKDYEIPFTAKHGETSRFKKPDNLTKQNVNITGKWEVDFSKNNPNDQYKAIGQFEQVDDYVTGTFMTETGDYRYLEGNMYNNNLYLSCYDGSHLFLFKATLVNEKLTGVFWSGTHWEEPWVATRNENFELTNPDSLTYLKEGFDKLAFTFPNTDGEEVSLTDEKYKGKVVIVNIMGPWCPNCKDETAYLSGLYDDNKEKGLEIIALSFDKSEEFEASKQNILKIKTFFDAKYDFLIAGKANKIAAAKSLPMLNHVMSYPTTIFIDRNGNIRKIRTGFYGPGTGAYYTRYTEEINNLIAKLLAEEVEN